MGHQWAWLPDVAATIAALLARRRELVPFARFHMQGPLGPGRQRNESGDPAGGRPLWRPSGSEVFSWWLVKLAAPFNATLREMVEMHYLWRLPVRLRNDKLVDFLGAEPHTPPRQRGLSDAARPGLSARRRGINQEAGEA